ncbi:hypothetical protein D3C81_1683140 [compost metagenome]
MRLELNGGFEHLQWRRVGSGFGAACFTEDVFDFGHRFNQTVSLLQQLRRFLRRQPWKRRRHVEQIALVQWR